MTRTDALDKLTKNVCEVKFIKKNGDERIMLCTLLPNLLPETNGNTKEVIENLITVYDLEFEGWRMINLDTLISFEVD